jgi:hypothetical protein
LLRAARIVAAALFSGLGLRSRCGTENLGFVSLFPLGAARRLFTLCLRLAFFANWLRFRSAHRLFAAFSAFL